MSHANVPDEPSSRRFPVALRKVPSITGWAVDEMTKILHGERHSGDSFLIDNPPPILIAYKWIPGSEPIMLHPQDWDFPCRMIEDLADRYKGMETREGGQDFYVPWRRKALSYYISPFCLVWSNELEDAFLRYENPETLISSNPRNIFRWEPPYVHENDLPLIFECPDELLSPTDRRLKAQANAQGTDNEGVNPPAKNEIEGQTGPDSTAPHKIDAMFAHVLNKDGPHYSEELDAAISAWTALFGSGEYKQERKSEKERIKGWLGKNRPGFSENAIDRISTVVNPNKFGGAPKM